MPTPIEILLDPITLTVIGLFVALAAVEHVFPARRLPSLPYWRSKGVAAFIVFILLSTYLPLLWSASLLPWQWLDLSALGKWGGAAVGLVLYEFGVYVWHRSMHASNYLWRGFHQMHHSSERLDTWSAFWFSPLDMLGWTALSSLCLTVIVGITAEAAMLVLYATTFLAIFQHANLCTPHWLGYIIQRPESHSLHHQKGVHTGNFSDLPIFDVLFGTFDNPREFADETGFYHGASTRVLDMLCFRDVSEPRSEGELAAPARLTAR